jgi:MFS family permease
MLAALLLAGGALLALGLPLGLTQPGLQALSLIWLGLGFGSSLIQTPAGRLLRRSARESDRPALFAAHFALSHGCWLIAYPLAGWLSGTVGLAGAFAVLAVLALAATLAAARLWPADDRAAPAHRHEAMLHQHRHVHDAHHQHPHEGWEGPEPHSHPHRHAPLRHSHAFVIDHHHRHWPTAG